MRLTSECWGSIPGSVASRASAGPPWLMRSIPMAARTIRQNHTRPTRFWTRSQQRIMADLLEKAPARWGRLSCPPWWKRAHAPSLDQARHTGRVSVPDPRAQEETRGCSRCDRATAVVERSRPDRESADLRNILADPPNPCPLTRQGLFLDREILGSSLNFPTARSLWNPRWQPTHRVTVVPARRPPTRVEVNEDSTHAVIEADDDGLRHEFV